MDENASDLSHRQVSDNNAPGGHPSAVQRRWLMRGLAQPGGKLPLFDSNGKRVSERTVRSCLEKGWAEPWFANPTKPDWLVCRLTDQGRHVLTANDVV